MYKHYELFGLLGAALSLSLLFSPGALAEQFDVVVLQEETPTQTTWSISRPNVRKSVTEYTQIRFKPGDTVKVYAKGCVQTGGSGRTWKRYVDPRGDNSDRLYHGLIHIPGITNKPVTIQQFGLNVSHKIPETLPGSLKPEDLFLRLGYQDDNFSDNGYWGHDDGTGDQCKGVGPAIVTISIGHNGTNPVNPDNFTGIRPSQFRCGAAWKFANFPTAALSWESYSNAFDLHWYDYLDPLTYAIYGLGRSMASTGNCFGMSLLSLVGEDEFAVGNLNEMFWNNYPDKNTPPTLVQNINTTHWKQLSTYFLTRWLTSRYNSPSNTAVQIQQDLARGNYGLISLSHNWGGHVMVPLSVQNVGGSKYQIQVYDPGRPCTEKPDQNSYPPIEIDGNSWSFQMASGNIWTNKDDDRIAYVPYQQSNEWREPINALGIVHIIFGEGTTVEQVTDGKGRKLFKKDNPKSQAEYDMSANGLGRDITRLPRFAWGGKRPRTDGPKFTLSSTPIPPELSTRSRQMMNDYNQAYGGSDQMYLIQNSQLNDLEFKLSRRNSKKPLKALVARQGHSYEINLDAAQSGVSIHPSIILHKAADLSSGISVKEKSGLPLKINMVHGMFSKPENNFRIQKTELVSAGSTPVKALLETNHNLRIVTIGQQHDVNINTEIITSKGLLKSLPLRKLINLRQQ